MSELKTILKTKCAKTMPILGIISRPGQGNGRKSSFERYHELKSLALKASSLWRSLSKKRGSSMIAEGTEQGQEKTGQGKAQKNVQSGTIFVR